MTTEKRSDELRQMVQERIKTFSRLEKAFYLTLVVTGIIMAVSVVYLQARTQEIQQEISALNRQIKAQEDELTDAKQEVNELSRLERIASIAEKADIKTQSGNLQKVD